MAMTPVCPGNSAPLAVCNIDPGSGIIYSPGCANYQYINTAGTTTLKTTGGVYYGLNCIAVGTTWTATPYDINVTGTTTTTNNLTAQITAAAVGFQGVPGPGGTGVRFTGSLVVVTSGTPGGWNVLWD